MNKICLDGELFVMENEYDCHSVEELYLTSDQIQRDCGFGNYYPGDERTLIKKNTSLLVDVLKDKLLLDINREENANNDYMSGKIFLSPGTAKKVRITIEYED